ncbi:hypothetical protein D3C87_979750 [compost metagenome]
MRFVVSRTGLHARRQVDVSAGAHGKLLPRRDIRRARIHILPGDQRKVSTRRDHRTDFSAGAQVVAVLLVPRQRLAVAFFKRGEVDVTARLQTRVVLDRDLRRRQVEIASCLHAEVARVHARYAGDVRTPCGAVVLRSRGRGQRDVASRRQGDVVALDQRHQIGQVIARRKVYDGTLDQAAGLVDDVGGGHDGGVARADGAAVDDVAVGRKLDVAAGHEGAVALQIAFTHQQVDLRHQHGLGAAVGQRDGLLDQPDQVGGELALLRFGQRGAQLDAVVQRELRAVGEQCLVLAVVVAETFQEALAGGSQDLVGDKFLFVEAVAQATGLAGRCEEFCAGWDQGVQAAESVAEAGVDGSGGAAVADGCAGLLQQVEQVVAGDRGAVADKARVGGNDVGRVGRAVDGEELAVRDGCRVGDRAHDVAAGQADAGDQDGAGRSGAAGAGCAAAERNRHVAAGGADGQFDGFCGQGLRVGAGGVLAVAVACLGDGKGADAGNDPLTAGADIVDGGAGDGQGAARGDLALVVGDGAGKRHGAARQDLGGV